MATSSSAQAAMRPSEKIFREWDDANERRLRVLGCSNASTLLQDWHTLRRALMASSNVDGTNMGPSTTTTTTNNSPSTPPASFFASAMQRPRKLSISIHSTMKKSGMVMGGLFGSKSRGPQAQNPLPMSQSCASFPSSSTSSGESNNNNNNNNNKAGAAGTSLEVSGSVGYSSSRTRLEANATVRIPTRARSMSTTVYYADDQQLLHPQHPAAATFSFSPSIQTPRSPKPSSGGAIEESSFPLQEQPNEQDFQDGYSTLYSWIKGSKIMLLGGRLKKEWPEQQRSTPKLLRLSLSLVEDECSELLEPTEGFNFEGATSIDHRAFDEKLLRGKQNAESEPEDESASEREGGSSDEWSSEPDNEGFIHDEAEVHHHRHKKRKKKSKKEAYLRHPSPQQQQTKRAFVWRVVKKETPLYLEQAEGDIPFYHSFFYKKG